MIFLSVKKKMGGILIESRTGERGLGVVIGIGLNINESKEDIPKILHVIIAQE